jgi:hypothetical protein
MENNGVKGTAKTKQENEEIFRKALVSLRDHTGAQLIYLPSRAEGGYTTMNIYYENNLLVVSTYGVTIEEVMK